MRREHAPKIESQYIVVLGTERNQRGVELILAKDKRKCVLAYCQLLDSHLSKTERKAIEYSHRSSIYTNVSN